MRGRERPLAAPVADLPEPVLDRADAVRRRVRRGRLVGGERGAVLALQRLQVADRGVQRRRLRIPDRQRRAQVLERLGVGEQRPRVLGGAAVGGGRLGVAPRQAEVAGDLGIRPSSASATRPCRSRRRARPVSSATSRRSCSCAKS